VCCRRISYVRVLFVKHVRYIMPDCVCIGPSLSAYIEIISYAKLLRDAKKRDLILVDKVRLPVAIGL
jgi:hypothetical protein